MENANDVTSHSLQSSMDCVICGHLSHGYHFGILACRACAAFFRRTVAERKVYKCRSQLNCEINKEQRNMCRACRFLKCEQKGMNKNDVQLNRDPIGRKPDTSSKTVEKEEPIFDLKCKKPARKIPVEILIPSESGPLIVLERMKAGCNQYVIEQQTLIGTFEYKNKGSTGSYLQYAECCRIRNNSVPIILKMLNEYFEPFDKLDKALKKNVLQMFCWKHYFTEVLYQTYQNTATLPENILQVCDGYYFNENNLEITVDNTPLKSEIIRSIDVIIRLMKKIRVLFERLEIDAIERSAMVGLMLWQDVMNLVPTCDEAKIVMESIMKELHGYITRKNGFRTTGSRIGSFMCVINDVESIARTSMELATMEKIFDSTNVEILDSLEY